MNRKPVKYIIPQIHKLNDCWFIQWIGKEYYIKNTKLHGEANIHLNKYFFINYMLIILILIISGLFPFKNIDAIFRSILLAAITGMQSGIAVAEDREGNNR